MPRQSFFLLGPRGVGKSTWARSELAGAHRFDLLDEGLYQSLLAEPSLFADELRTVPKGSWVVVDEVQRIPSLLNEVHRFIEERKEEYYGSLLDCSLGWHEGRNDIVPWWNYFLGILRTAYREFEAQKNN